MIDKFFDDLENFLIHVIEPNSNRLDLDNELLEEIFQKLIKLNALKLLIPASLGGLGGGRTEWIYYNIKMAQYSGALLFLQAQHQFAISQLIKLLDLPNTGNILQNISTSNQGLGIALSAQRQLLQVTRANHGFKISGHLKWVTGFQYFPYILFSFDLHEKVYYAILPFSEKENELLISPTIQTAVFCSTNTVSITFNHYFLSDQEIIISHEFREKSPMEHPTVYNFAGAAKALLKITEHAKYHDVQLAKQKHQRLVDDWENYYLTVKANNICPLALRAEGQALAERCANFARMVCGADSLLNIHPVNRICREIWQYSIAGYSVDQLNAYLKTCSKISRDIL